MNRSVLSKAGEWLRRVGNPTATHPPPAAPADTELDDPGDSAAQALEGKLTLERIVRGKLGGASPSEEDLRLLDFIGEDLTQRARSLRSAIRELDPTSTGSSLVAYQNSVEELDKLEEMAHAICAIVHEARHGEALVAADILDPIRRAIRSLGDYRASNLTVRVNTPPDVPRVLSKPAVLVRTLGLCLDASTLTARTGGPVLVKISHGTGGDDRVCAQFRATDSLSILAPALRRRLHSTLALATRLAATFGAELHVDATDSGFAPRLLLLAEGAR